MDTTAATSSAPTGTRCVFLCACCLLVAVNGDTCACQHPHAPLSQLEDAETVTCPQGRNIDEPALVAGYGHPCQGCGQVGRDLYVASQQVALTHPRACDLARRGWPVVDSPGDGVPRVVITAPGRDRYTGHWTADLMHAVTGQITHGDVSSFDVQRLRESFEALAAKRGA